MVTVAMGLFACTSLVERLAATIIIAPSLPFFLTLLYSCQFSFPYQYDRLILSLIIIMIII